MFSPFKFETNKNIGRVFDIHISHLSPLHPSKQSQVYVEEDKGKHAPFRQLSSVQISINMTR